MKIFLSIAIIVIALVSTELHAQVWEPTEGPRRQYISLDRHLDMHADLDNRLYATPGHIFVTSDKGETWSHLLKDGNPIACTTMTIDPLGAIHAIQFLNNSSKLITSTDAGTTWSEVDFGFSYITDFIALDNGILLVGIGSNVFRSIDAGHNWTQVGPGASLHLGVSGKVYMGRDDSLFISTDKGESWEKLIMPEPAYHIYEVGNDIFLTATNHEVYKYTFGGSSWKLLPWPSAFKYFIICAKREQSLYAFAYTPSVFRSDDNGETWIELTDGIPADKFVWEVFADRTGSLYLDVNNIVYREVTASVAERERNAGSEIWRSHNDVYIRCSAETEPVAIRCFDLLGREVRTSEIEREAGGLKRLQVQENVHPLLVQLQSQTGVVSRIVH